DAKITSGYNLPASHVIHTVGPRGEHPLLLSSCYKRVMDIVKENDLKSVAFCCVSTGIYGYDNEKAAHVAFKTLHDWLDAHEDQVEKMDRIVLCVFLDKDENIYKRLLPQYFPKPDDATERQTAS
ncbi:O-acetyl-ADP-ribose deacetylase macrod1, partial [Gamsiella multidivaricata]